MSNKEILANSLLVRGYHYLGFLIRESALVKWYVGSDNYSELHWFRQSVTYRGLALVGKPVGALLTGIGGLLHRLIHPSCTKEVLVNLRKDWQGRPLALLGLFGIGMVVFNTIGRFLLGDPPDLQGQVIRGGLIILGFLMVRSTLTWSGLTESSLVVKYLRKLVVEP
ncbi:MAG: hypothetical protein ACYDG6_01975 [Thermincolia bacterium]